MVPLSNDRDQERGRVRLGGHDHHLDRDEVTPPSMPREEDFSRIMRKPNKPKKAVSTMASSEATDDNDKESTGGQQPRPADTEGIHVGPQARRRRGRRVRLRVQEAEVIEKDERVLKMDEWCK